MFPNYILFFCCNFHCCLGHFSLSQIIKLHSHFPSFVKKKKTKNPVQNIFLSMTHLQNSLKCVKTKSHLKPIFSPYLPKKELSQEKQKPTNEQFNSRELGWSWFSFPCSFVQLENGILQLTLFRGKV